MTPTSFIGRFRMVELRFELWSDDSELGDHLRWLFDPFSTHDAVTDRYDIDVAPEVGPQAAVVRLNGEQVLAPVNRDHAARAIAWHLNTRVMTETTVAVAVHAGAVALGGRVVVLPGHADAGKSTLVAALVAAGFDYLSDEGALIGARTGLVHPYPRPIALDDRSIDVLGLGRPARPHWLRLGWLVRHDQLRNDATVGSAGKAALIAIPTRRYGGGAAVALRRTAAVRELSDRSPNLERVGCPGFDGLVACVRGARTVFLPVDRLDEAVDEIRSLLTVAV